MKKIIGISAFAVFSLTLFSFSTTEVKKANYNEVKESSIEKLLDAGSFQKYENGHYTSDRGTWNTKKQIWTLTAEKSALNAIEKTLNKQ
jgi:hypothetical protein